MLPDAFDVHAIDRLASGGWSVGFRASMKNEAREKRT